MSTSTVPGVSFEDVVDPGDAALQALLAGIAERTADPEKRNKVLDMIVTLPPLREWTTASLVRLHDAASSAIGRGRQLPS